jgi:predicted lipoprotein with Yx(FWY)xxD motif
MRGRITVPLLLVAAAGAGAAIALAGSATSGTVAMGKTGKLGTVLVAANGHTLYRYTPDSKGVNRCSAVPACNAYWPALVVKAGTKPSAGAGVSAKLLGTIKAPHGMVQITYAGYPVYFFSGDKKAGQTNGQGFESKWYVVSSTGALVKHAAAAAAATTTAATTTSPGYGYG